MYCSNCGHLCDDNASFCANCGSKLAPASASENAAADGQVHTAPVSAAAHTVNDPSLPSLASILVIGIISLATCELGVPGIVLGAIGKSKAKQVLAAGGELGGKGKAGNIMSKLGFIFGIIMTVIWIIWLLAMVAACSSLAFYY